MFEIILHYFIFLLIIFSNGLIFQNIFLKQDIINSNFFELAIIGLITTGFIAHLLNFIIPLNNLTIYLNLIVGSFFISLVPCIFGSLYKFLSILIITQTIS